MSSGAVCLPFSASPSNIATQHRRLSIVPCVLLVVSTERFKIQSWTFYLVCGLDPRSRYAPGDD
jgi:hypothetical protein